MTHNNDPNTHPHLDPETMLLIVVGAHLEAEFFHRPLAAGLVQSIRRWQTENGCDQLRPVICTDIWYVNHRELWPQPAIAIGAPEVNAASAWLGNRLPTAFVIEGSMRVHLDPEFIDMQACVWGIDPEATESALETFEDRYLGEFLQHAHGHPVRR